jgi:hypothetical protein
MIRYTSFLSLFVLVLIGIYHWADVSTQVESSEEVMAIKKLSVELKSRPELFSSLIGEKDEASPSPSVKDSVLPKIIRQKETKFRESIGRFFGGTDEDDIVQDYLASKHANLKNKKLLKEIARKLSKDPKRSLEVIGKAYLAMPGGVHQYEHMDLIELASLVASDKASTDPEGARESAKAFLEEVISSKADPIDSADPLGSVTMRALGKLMQLEQDPARRKELANNFLKEHRSPSVKAELTRLLDDVGSR